MMNGSCKYHPSFLPQFKAIVIYSPTSGVICSNRLCIVFPKTTYTSRKSCSYRYCISETWERILSDFPPISGTLNFSLAATTGGVEDLQYVLFCYITFPWRFCARASHTRSIRMCRMPHEIGVGLLKL